MATRKDFELDLLRKAVAAVKFHIAEQADLETLDFKPLSRDRNLPNAQVRLKAGNKETVYHAEIKADFSHAVRLYLLMKKSSFERPLLLVTSYVNPKMADQLKLDGLEFIDTAGNVFIHRAPLYVFVKGNKLPDRAPLATSPRMFKVSGLKIVFAFLCRPDLLNKTYREIAVATGVALGTVDWIMAELKDGLFFVDMAKGNRRLARKDDLFLRWVAAYPERLRPRLHLGRYQGEPGWWEKANLRQWDAQWGGEVAAARITGYLSPELATVYLPPSKLNDFLVGNRLRRDDAGSIEVLERFWPTGDHSETQETVHPILIYADLVATGNERNIEAAKIIYDRHIVRYLRED